MRWEGLFADLEAQAGRLSAAEIEGEVDERTRFETGQLSLIDRLRPAVGQPVSLRCRTGLVVAGELRQVGPEWLLLAEGGGREAVVTVASVLTATGLSRLSAAPGTISAVQARLGLRHVLRGIARDRSAVRLHLGDGSLLDGTIDRVGADFIEVAVHAAGEARRRSEVRQVAAVALAALIAIRRDADL